MGEVGAGEELEIAREMVVDIAREMMVDIGGQIDAHRINAKHGFFLQILLDVARHDKTSPEDRHYALKTLETIAGFCANLAKGEMGDQCRA